MHGQMSWRVKDKLFVWERPLRKSDLKALGDAAPIGEILGARVEHEGAKLALIESDPDDLLHDPALRRVLGGARTARARSASRSSRS